MELEMVDEAVKQVNKLEVAPAFVVWYPVSYQDDGEILFYSHLDKQPEASGWTEGKGPWKPVIEDDWLFIFHL